MNIDVGKVIGIALGLTLLIVVLATVRMTRRERAEEESAHAAPATFADLPSSGEEKAP